MKKRLAALVLTLGMVLALLPVSAFAALTYGQAPIYTGYQDVDYMAQELLKTIDLSGKSSTQKIQAVYDWMCRNCARDGQGTPPAFTPFDPEVVDAQAEGAFYEQYIQDLGTGKITLRLDLSEERGTYDPELDAYFFSVDSNESVAAYAYDMMMERTGNCVHFSSLLAVLLGHLGFDCRVIEGEFLNSSGSRVEHKWNLVLVDGEYRWLDVRMDQAATKNGVVPHTYFLKTSGWETKHAWDHAFSDELMVNAADVQSAYNELLAIPEQVLNETAQERGWRTCSSWAEQSMTQASQAGLIPDSIWAGDMTQAITRQEFAGVAMRFYEKLSGTAARPWDEEQDGHPFTDTQDADVLNAYALGIVQGVGNGKFDPKGTLTREQASAMLGRVCELVENGTIENKLALPAGGAKVTFDDAASIGSWAKNYVDYLVAKGAISGNGAGKFLPKDNMTREQALKVAVSALGADTTAI